VMRLVFKLPLLFDRLSLRFLIPKWILILVTTGRRSGKLRRTALEYGYDAEKKRYFLMSGWHGRSDWYRNARANPRVQLWIGGQRMEGYARPATDEDVAQEMESIISVTPLAVNTWAAHSGVKYDGTRASLLRMAPAFPSLMVCTEGPGAA
jgi:deazaflavin-dependent oxidoreductase (nitroreductase family)